MKLDKTVRDVENYTYTTKFLVYTIQRAARPKQNSIIKSEPE